MLKIYDKDYNITYTGIGMIALLIFIGGLGIGTILTNLVAKDSTPTYPVHIGGFIVTDRSTGQNFECFTDKNQIVFDCLKVNITDANP